MEERNRLPESEVYREKIRREFLICERESLMNEQGMLNRTNDHIALWDNLKFLLILLVVVGHFADFFTAESNSFRALFLFIYSFHMPMFFFISGLFFSEKKNRIKSAVLSKPYVSSENYPDYY